MDARKFPAATSLDPQKLEELTYERSKFWASFFKDVEATAANESEGILIEDLEDAFADIDKDDVWSSADEAKESDVEDDYSAVQDILNWSIAHGKNFTNVVCNSNTYREDGELQEMLNQTLPIVQQHERRWKEAGLNRALDTFDADIIEKEVGSWLRRRRSAITSKKTQARRNFGGDTDTDSLHSDDTARYIRTTRNRIAKTKRRSDCTVSIKSFRKKQKLRKELNANYAYHQCNCQEGPKPPKAWHSVCISNGTSNGLDYKSKNMTASNSEDENESKLLSKNNAQFTEQNSSKEKKQRKRVSRSRLKIMPVEHNDTTDSETSVQMKYSGKKKTNQCLKIKKKKEIKTPRSSKGKLPIIKLPIKKGKKEMNAENVDETDTDEKELAVAIVLSKKSHKNKQKKATVLSSDNNSATLECTSSGMGTLSTHSSCSTDSFEDTARYYKSSNNIKLGAGKDSFFLNVSKNICNSTALKNDSAVKRQFCILPSIEENSVCTVTSTKLCKQSITIETSVNSKATEVKPKIDSTPKTLNKTKAVSAINYDSDAITTSGKVNRSAELMNMQQTPPRVAGNDVKPVLVFTPQHKHLATDGYFNINQENLSPVLGKKLAKKLTKYHIGPRRYPSSSMVYYYPPKSLPSSDTTSDEDELERFGLYGEFQALANTDATPSK